MVIDPASIEESLSDPPSKDDTIVIDIHDFILRYIDNWMRNSVDSIDNDRWVVTYHTDTYRYDDDDVNSILDVNICW